MNLGRIRVIVLGCAASVLSALVLVSQGCSGLQSQPEGGWGDPAAFSSFGEAEPIQAEVAPDLTALAQERDTSLTPQTPRTPVQPSSTAQTVQPIQASVSSRSTRTFHAPRTVPAGSGRAPASTWDGSYSTYVVRRGDTLMKISFMTSGNVYAWRRIYQDNRSRILDPNSLIPGTVFRIRGPGDFYIQRNGEPYLIRRSDTLWRISDQVYGNPFKWPRLWHNNAQLIRDPNRIYAGFHLYYVKSGGKPSPGHAPLGSALKVPPRTEAAREPAGEN